MIYGEIKNRKIKKYVRGILSPEKVWIDIGFNNIKVKKTAYAMLKYFKSIGFYERRWSQD